MSGPQKRVYIRTFGCQMNVADSELMSQLLAPDYALTERPEEADLYLINTCAIRRKSQEKVLSLVGQLKSLKRRRPELIIGVGGCVAQQEGERLLQAAPHLDLVFGTRGIFRLPQLVDRAAGQRTVDVDLEGGCAPLPRRTWAAGMVQAFVTIMQGCDNFCSFCVVPYVRGRERSRPPDEIIAEVSGFLAQGGREVTLLGQNVNSYGRGLAESITFPQLLGRLAGLPDLKRLRFATSHPKDLSPELIAAFRNIPALCEHLHLPAQSGSNRVLAAMNRGYSREEYLKKVARLKETCPELSLSTDLIVGFPGETDADFQDTLDLVRQAGFHQAFSFKYSPRPQTRAATLPDQVPEHVKSARLRELNGLLAQLQSDAQRRLVGREAEVLVEGMSKRSPQELTGRLRTNQIVNFPGPSQLIGRFVTVRLTEAHAHSLKGELAGPAAAA
jgi:tRNA-2-methylthio-N6-dimethylallyladenosine synthase